MIREIQKYVRGSLDDSISIACINFLTEIKKSNLENWNNKIILFNKKQKGE